MPNEERDMRSDSPKTVNMYSDADASFASIPVSSKFTAINHAAIQLQTPQSSPTPPYQQNQARRRVRNVKRRHHPAVAQYLGLGCHESPPKLESNPLSSALSRNLQVNSTPKQPRSTPDSVSMTPLSKKAHGEKENALNHGSGLADRDKNQHVPSFSAYTFNVPESSNLKETSVASSDDFDLLSVNSRSTNYLRSQAYWSTNESSLNSLSSGTARDIYHNPDLAPCLVESSIDSCDTNHHKVKSSALIVTESDSMKPKKSDYGDDFNEDIDDLDLLELISAETEAHSNSTLACAYRPSQPNGEADFDERDSSEHKKQMKAHQHNTNFSPPQNALRHFVSRFGQNTRALAGQNSDDRAEAIQLIVRSPFPAAAGEHSPILGLTSHNLLRTCFRIGEAINQSWQVSKAGRQVTLELYARVFASERKEQRQVFTLCDLFHTKPPYLKAVYEAAIWESVPLFEYDSRRLLQQGRMCRCIGVMKGEGKERTMVVLNVWEVTWDDVKWVEGIVSA